jgi:hypothetical protein
MVDRYLLLLEGRASGTLMTQATWLRKVLLYYTSLIALILLRMI